MSVGKIDTENAQGCFEGGLQLEGGDFGGERRGMGFLGGVRNWVSGDWKSVTILNLRSLNT